MSTCYLQTIEDLEERVKSADIEIVVRTSFLTEPANAVHNLKVSVEALWVNTPELWVNTKALWVKHTHCG